VVDGVSAGMPVWRLVVTDFRGVFTAPARWDARDWGLFSLAVAGVAGVSQADRPLQKDVLGPSAFATHLADGFRPFGSYAAFGVLGGFYLGGLVAGDNKAQETALDGFIASLIAGGVITPFLKEAVGRSRPSAHLGVYDFHPFSGAASFPSGETTQAFVVGSVVAAEYPKPWVEIVSYGTATLVAYARMRENAHFASDVLAGAIIGTVVGRAVVHINQRLRARISAAPLLGPNERGLVLATAF
jgi:membrane-associated phospholipid phosphatase